MFYAEYGAINLAKSQGGGHVYFVVPHLHSPSIVDSYEQKCFIVENNYRPNMVNRTTFAPLLVAFSRGGAILLVTSLHLAVAAPDSMSSNKAPTEYPTPTSSQIPVVKREPGGQASAVLSASSASRIGGAIQNGNSPEKSANPLALPSSNPTAMERHGVDIDTRPLWSVLLHRTPGLISKIKDVLVNLLVLTGSLALIGAFWWEWRRNVVVIDALEVPKELTEKGYSGVVFAQRLADQIYSIQRTVRNRVEGTGVEVGGLQTDFQVPAANLSLKTLVRYVRQVFKRNEIRIRGEVTTQGKKYALQLRTSNGRATSTRPARTTSEFENLLKVGAEDVILLAVPLLALQYRFLDEYNVSCFPRTLDAVRFFLSTTPSRQHKFAYTVWGNVLTVMDDFDGAIEKYRIAISIDKAYAPAYNGWGNALRRRQEFDSAIEKYKDAIRHSRKNDVAMLNLGLVFLDKRDHASASRWFKKALTINPANPSASLNLGISKRDVGQTDEALRYIRQSLDVDPNFAPGYLQLAITLRRKLRRNDAISTIKKGLALGFPMANLYGVWGDILTDNSEYQLAIEKYDEALRSSSDYAPAKLGKAGCLGRLKHFDSAIFLVKTVIEQAPKLAQATLTLGDIYLDVRRFGDAKTQFTKALRLDGGEAAANIGLSRVDEALYDYRSAGERIEKAITAEPTSVKAHLRRGWIRFLTHDASGAHASFAESCRIDEYSIAGICGLGHYFRYRLDFDESLEHFNRAIEMDDFAVEPLIGAGRTYMAMERQHEALGAFEDAIAIDPQNVLARVGRIDTLRRLKGPSDASAWSESRALIDQLPHHPDGYVAMAYLALDENEEHDHDFFLVHAMNCLECVLAQDPRHPNAQLAYARVELRAGLPHDADKRLSALIEQNEYFLDAYKLKASILLEKLERPIESLSTIRSAAKVAPQNPGIFLDLGGALQAQGLIEEAVGTLEFAANLAPYHFPITTRLSELKTLFYSRQHSVDSDQ